MRIFYSWEFWFGFVSFSVDVVYLLFLLFVRKANNNNRWVVLEMGLSVSNYSIACMPHISWAHLFILHNVPAQSNTIIAHCAKRGENEAKQQQRKNKHKIAWNKFWIIYMMKADTQHTYKFLLCFCRVFITEKKSFCMASFMQYFPTFESALPLRKPNDPELNKANDEKKAKKERKTCLVDEMVQLPALPFNDNDDDGTIPFYLVALKLLL